MKENASNSAPDTANQEVAPLKGMGKMVFSKDSLETLKRARGDKEQPSYELPEEIKEQLEEIDREAARVDAGKEAEGAEGKVGSDGTEGADGVSSRYYQKAQRLAARSQNRIAATFTAFKRNLKLFFIILIAFVGYYLYAEYIREDDLNSIEDLKTALPLKLDEYTALTAIDDAGSGPVVMHFIKAAEYYGGVSEADREASLDRIAVNAQALCKNPLLGAIVRNGRQLTVILGADDGSFERVIEIKSCELEKSPQASSLN